MNDEGLALVLTGGGARAAYQVGFLQHLASRHPHLAPGILTGVSAGGIIATWLALRDGSFGEAIDQLSEVWQGLRTEDVFRVDPGDLTSRVTRWGVRLVSGGAPGTPRARSLLDTAPLRQLLARTLKPDSEGQLPAIARNLAAGTLHALALTASSYTTGQSVTWVQDVEGCGVMTSEPPERKSAGRCLGVEDLFRPDKAAVEHEVVTQRAPPDMPQELQVVPRDIGELPADGGQLGLRHRLEPAGRVDAVDRSEQSGVVGQVRSTHGERPSSPAGGAE